MKTCPVIVVGHVDHGKTALVRALTGIETDRLAEERIRGISITAGFAHRRYGDLTIDFIDAPGHEKFVRAMVCGASGARAVLLVISAADGIQAQTLEHIQIAQALGIRHGIVAITKTDLLSDAGAAIAEAELRAGLADTMFRDAPFISCSSATGHGLDQLHEMLARTFSEPADTGAPLAAFLPIDRVFVSEGHGTIVTGTLLGGSLAKDDALVLASTGQSITIRAIQARGIDLQRVGAGERVALNLRGLSASQVSPGDVLHVPGVFAPSMQCDVALYLSAQESRPVRHMEEVRVLCGTAHVIARLRLLEARDLAPGAMGFAQLLFSRPVATFAGQRAIIRSLSPAQTLGGAIILDPVACSKKMDRKLRCATLKAALCGNIPELASALSCEHQGAASIADIARLARAPAASVRAELATNVVPVTHDLVALASVVDAVKDRVLKELQAFHRDQPLKSFAPRALVSARTTAAPLQRLAEDQLVSDGKLIRSGDAVALAQHAPLDQLTVLQRERMDQLDRLLQEAGLTPPAPDALIADPVDADLVALLIQTGAAVRLHNVSLKQTLLFHADAISAAAENLRREFCNSRAFKTGEARAVLNTTRKHIVPLLEYFDACGVTVRGGNSRKMI